LIKKIEGLGCVTSNKQLHVGGHLDHDVDTGIFLPLSPSHSDPEIFLTDCFNVVG